MGTEEPLVDFYNGAHLLERVATWAYVVSNREMILDSFIAFEKAFERLVELHAAGKLGAGAADFSEENLERVKRIRRLIQPGLDSAEAQQAAQEIYTLADRALRGLIDPGSAGNPQT